jgi:hypothetical protein
MIREIRPTGKRIQQTYEEYIRYYHWPPTHFSDANSKIQRSQLMEPSTELHYPFSLVLAACSL